MKLFSHERLTLKSRIMIIFLASSLIPFISIGLISYYAIYSILTNKIQTAVQSQLKQVKLSLENTINNMNHVSQQLAFDGAIGKKLDQLLASDEPYSRAQITDEFKNELSLVAFTNPSVGLILYYFKNDRAYMFENLGVKEDFSLKKLPLLAEYYGISYYGPHVSNNRFDNQYVLSALRKVDLPDRDDVYVYIESGFHLAQSILNNEEFGNAGSHLILDNEGRVAYSEVPGVFPVDSIFSSFTGTENSGVKKDYYWVKAISNQGWSIISLVPTAEYNKEMNRWFFQILLIALIFLAVSLMLAWLLWRMVYRPLRNFNKEIKQLSQNAISSNLVTTNIPEFDHLLIQFRQMKKQIWELFAEVEQKEKRRADLEVEKLLYQINPHFLMNTLDTVHWLAVMNGQSEIDRFVLSLNKLLYYNLGKQGQSSTVQEEIDALKQYLILQQIRYDFQFDVQIHGDDEVLKQPIPRFILQPIVENALYHGLEDDGYIHVDVKLKLRESIEISIRDNGAGMTESAIQNLLNSEKAEPGKVGMGIGMNYVKRVLENYYGKQAVLKITSVPGQETTVFLSLPVLEVPLT